VTTGRAGALHKLSGDWIISGVLTGNRSEEVCGADISHLAYSPSRFDIDHV